MKPQTYKEMMEAGASKVEALKANELFTLLKPTLKINRNGRIETAYGDKTVLGFYRSVKRCLED